MIKTQKITYDESLINDLLTTMIPGDYHYMCTLESVLERKPELIRCLNNSEKARMRKWRYHSLSGKVFCMTPRVYNFVSTLDEWRGGITHLGILPFLQIRPNPIPHFLDPVTEQEIQEAGEQQESMILESEFMGKFIASGHV